MILYFLEWSSRPAAPRGAWLWFALHGRAPGCVFHPKGFLVFFGFPAFFFLCLSCSSLKMTLSSDCQLLLILSYIVLLSQILAEGRKPSSQFPLPRRQEISNTLKDSPAITVGKLIGVRNTAYMRCIQLWYLAYRSDPFWEDKMGIWRLWLLFLRLEFPIILSSSDTTPQGHRQPISLWPFSA